MGHVKVSDKLIRQAQEGDEDAQDALLRRCEPIAKRLAQQLHYDGIGALPSGATGSETRAAKRARRLGSADYDDRVQEALISIWRLALPKYDFDRGAAFTTHAWWWARSGIKAWLKKSRRHERRTRSDTDGSLDPLTHMRQLMDAQRDARLEADERQELLFERIRSLPLELQRIVFYRYWEGMNLRQVEALSRKGGQGLSAMSRQKVLNLENKALAELRKLYGVEEEEE